MEVKLIYLIFSLVILLFLIDKRNKKFKGIENFINIYIILKILSNIYVINLDREEEKIMENYIMR